MGQTDRPDDRRAAGSRLPPTANLLSKGITKRLNPESQNARKSRRAPGFLAKSNTCSRQITAINQRLPNTSRTTKSDSSQSGQGKSETVVSQSRLRSTRTGGGRQPDTQIHRNRRDQE